VSKKFPSIDPLSQPGLPSSRTDALLATHLSHNGIQILRAGTAPPVQSHREYKGKKYSGQMPVVCHEMRALPSHDPPPTEVERDLTSV
jgi:hypothetical protein